MDKQSRRPLEILILLLGLGVSVCYFFFFLKLETKSARIACQEETICFQEKHLPDGCRGVYGCERQYEDLRAAKGKLEELQSSWAIIYVIKVPFIILTIWILSALLAFCLRFDKDWNLIE